MIRGLWGDLRGYWTEDYHQSLDGFVRRMTGVARLEWITMDQGHTVIEALKKLAERWKK
jgi:hypothetical protein